MGPITRCVGPLVAPEQIWQDPCPAKPAELISDADVATLKETLLGSGVSPADLVSAAWASASTFRKTDYRGGANGARIRLAPQKDWPANAGVGATIAKLEEVKAAFGKEVSIADLIVLGGCAAVEAAAKQGGVEVTVPFSPGRTDATDEQTDTASFAVLEPKADGFRNYGTSTPHMLVDKAHLLNLSGEYTNPINPLSHPGMLSDQQIHARHSPGDDLPRRRPSRPRDLLWLHWCSHRNSGDPEQRLLRQPPRHGHHLGA